MDLKIPHLIIAAAIILSLHLVGVFAGLYDSGTLIDVPQHVLGGAVLGAIWLSLLKLEEKNCLSKSLVLVSTLGFAVLGSVGWEVLEFVLWNLFPSFANSFKLYSPTVGELLVDVASGLFGGLLVGLYAYKKEYGT